MRIMRYVESADVSFRIPWIDLMLEHERRGIEQVLLCRQGGNMERAASERGIRTHTWKSAAPFFPPANLRYPMLVRRVSPDIVHTRLSNAAYIAGFWGSRLGVPTIAMIDGAYKFKYYRRADHYTACSRWAADAMIRQGVPPGKIDVVYNSIEVGKYRPSCLSDELAGRALRERCGFGPEDRVFIGAGSFVRVKGFDILLRAFSLLRADEDAGRARLLLVGDGPLRGEYASIISSLGIGNFVAVSDSYAPDIRPWMWASDFFVLPSRAEPFGIILLEAMASGLPAIATDEGGPGEVITDGIDGLLSPAGSPEALAARMRRMLFMSGAERGVMTARAGARLAAFTSAALASREEEVYRKVLEATRSKGA